MKKGALDVSTAEQIKWRDALDLIIGQWNMADVDLGGRMARECSHPDAVWLVSLFPTGVAVTRERMFEVMVAQGEDPRALYFAWQAGGDFSLGQWLVRSAELGYAPAQARRAERCVTDEECLFWARKAAAAGDRSGMTRLGICYLYGAGCEQDQGRAIELFKAAAELGCALGQDHYGFVAFSVNDWERYYWWRRSTSRRTGCHFYGAQFVSFLLSISFEKGMGRILHNVAPIVRRHQKSCARGAFDRMNMPVLEHTMLGIVVPERDAEKLQGLLLLHDAMLQRARQAIACWSLAAWRLGMAKDMRVMIAKMAWDEPWRWDVAKEGSETDVL
jgi:TPR repeat protein